ncbi:NUDIX domain-containing protein [Dactylosporangium sp. NPDC050688]|uniref:NUDIX domain-containing protein n=1 Tax=Dactylosporangium sp. NPDC050688 TaxID=3157217 RepID=UPI0034092CF6
MPVDLRLLYTCGDQMLVGRRRGGFAAGQWDSPSGKLEPGEALEHGMAREAFEETGLRLPPAQLRVVAMTHWHPPDGVPRIGVFFHLEADPAVHGEPVIAEPAKCAELRWAPLDALPRPLLRYTEIGVELFCSGRVYAAVDWPTGSNGPR